MSIFGYIVNAIAVIVTSLVSRHFGMETGIAAGAVVAGVGSRVLHVAPAPGTPK